MDEEKAKNYADMTIGERIKKVRKEHLNLSLEKFGERIGMKKGSLSQVETGTNAASNQVIRLVSLTYGIREEWLRTGTGEMLTINERAADIGILLRNLQKDGPDSAGARMVSALARLDVEDWKKIEEVARLILGIKDEGMVT